MNKHFFDWTKEWFDLFLKNKPKNKEILMTRREKMQAIFDRRQIENSPVSIRIDLWHTNAVANNSLPYEIKGMSFEAIEDTLGFCRAARYRTHPTLKFRNVEIYKIQDNEHMLEEYRFPEKTLTRETHRSEDMKRQGFIGHITEYPLKKEHDYKLLLNNMDRAVVHTDITGFDVFDHETGDTGLPMLIINSCPAHLLMLNFTGYEQFFFHRMDFPETLNELIDQIDKIYRRELWPAVAKSNARIILHGNHFSSQMTPPPIFEQYFLPYFTDFNLLMHENGKKVIWHADAEMGALLNYVLEAGFDGADCLATKPLTPQTIEDYFEAWNGKIICWGGLPSIIFDPTFPINEYKEYVISLVETTKNRNDFIFGASDNVMPGTEWERILFLSEATGSLPH